MDNLLKRLDEVSEDNFFTWFDEAQAIADKHDVEIHQIYNVRQVWDLAFTAGALAYAKEQVAK